MILRQGLVLLSSLLLSTLAQAPPKNFEPTPDLYGPFYRFKTEPYFEISFLDVTVTPEDPSIISPDYIFFELANFDGVGPWGPQIRDMNGELVFFGKFLGLASGDPHACDYLGVQLHHMCSASPAWGGTIKHVYNESYDEVGLFEYGGTESLGNPDGHEFHSVNSGFSLLFVIFEWRTFDLTPYFGPEDGRVFDACFQERDAMTDETIFEWCYLDHLPIWETYIWMNRPENTVNKTSFIAGKGTEGSPWDFAHPNSIDKNDDGDFLFSLRHLDALLLIAGAESKSGKPPGTILWQLGGKSNDFDISATGLDVLFSRQHHVRFVSTGPEETTFTLFDNGWEGINDATVKQSAGLFITINNKTMTARINKRFNQPRNRLANSQGSMQRMIHSSTPETRTNIFIGWGWLAELSEFSDAGELLWHAIIGDGLHMHPYRARKSPWTGKPRWAPKMVVYSQFNTSSPLLAYVSWNGDTRTTSWRFKMSLGGQDGPWMPIGDAPKQGFETEVNLTELVSGGSFIVHSLLMSILPRDFLPHWIMVEALDRHGQVLHSTQSRTFIPIDEIHKACNERGCDALPNFDYNKGWSSLRLTEDGQQDIQSAYLRVGVLLLVLACLGMEAFGNILGFVLESHSRAALINEFGISKVEYFRLEGEEEEDAMTSSRRRKHRL